MKRSLLLFLAAIAAWPLFARPGEVYGYLFCHMSRRGEWTAFALSRDGVHFRDLLGGGAVYDVQRLSPIEGGARDAYIARAADGRGFVMVTTDMCVARSGEWFNHGIDLLRSDDLLEWSSVAFDFRQGPGIFCDPASPDLYDDWSTVCRVWAPQVIWDPDYRWDDGSRGGYMIYYSLLNGAEDRYDRIFYSYADRSFTRLTKPRVLIDWGYATIDADISYVPADGRYHLLIKKEGGPRGIFFTSSPSLRGPYPEPQPDDRISEGDRLCEGPSAFRLAGDSTWRVGYVEYSSSPARYRICRADERLADFHSPVDMQGEVDPQHGSFLALTEEEYLRLERWAAAKAAADTSKEQQ